MVSIMSYREAPVNLRPPPLGVVLRNIAMLYERNILAGLGFRWRVVILAPRGVTVGGILDGCRIHPFAAGGVAVGPAERAARAVVYGRGVNKRTAGKIIGWGADHIDHPGAPILSPRIIFFHPQNLL